MRSEDCAYTGRKAQIMTGLNKALGLSVLVAAATLAHGQEATERFVPIGQSPGQSGKTTTVGTVQAVNPQARSLSVAADGKVVTLGWSERTRIWLDRSRQQQGALKGSASDLQVGRRVEVKTSKKESGQADWIKVEPVASPN